MSRSAVSAVKRQGITLVELLIAVAVMGIVFTLLATFLSFQAQVTSSTQAQNEVEIAVRGAAEVVAQDLQMAGSRSILTDTGTVYAEQLHEYCTALSGEVDPEFDPSADSFGSTAPCAVLQESSGRLIVFYATSLRAPTELCRRVDYELQDDSILMRSDVACGAAPEFTPFVSGVSAFDVAFLCEDGSGANNTLGCYTASSAFPQQASVTINGTSENQRAGRQATVTLSTSLPNLRPIAVSE